MGADGSSTSDTDADVQLIGDQQGVFDINGGGGATRERCDGLDIGVVEVPQSLLDTPSLLGRRSLVSLEREGDEEESGGEYGCLAASGDGS